VLSVELARCDRLVLLGDVLELRQRPLAGALAAARPVLKALAAALPRHAEIVLVPGNHDYHLLAAWFERHAVDGGSPELGISTAVDWVGGELLGDIAELMGAGRVRARYPGVWLRPDVYATHGHYADRHTTVPMLERLGAGAMARIVGEPSDGPLTVEDYEATLAPIYAWVHEVAQHDGPRLRRSTRGTSARAWQMLEGSSSRRSLGRRAMSAAFPALIFGLSHAGLGPLHADISGPELRRAALRAFGEVMARTSVNAPYVVFGHTHRAGPLPRDDRAEWRAPTGSSLLNSGSWVYDRAFLGDDPQSSPYRPGFAVVVGDEGPPALVNLLDED
jgi:predicted phosphodiesterase